MTFEDVLVVTDRNDLAVVPVRHRDARERRFVDRLRAVAIDLLFPTGPTTFEPAGPADDVEVQTENASRHGISLARHHGARLHVLFVVDAVRYDTTVEFATDPLVEEGEAALDELVEEAERAGLEAVGSVEVGRPGEVVLAYVDEHDVDLVVLNGRATGRLRTRLRPGLVETLTRRGTVPVYVVPWGERGRPD